MAGGFPVADGDGASLAANVTAASTAPAASKRLQVGLALPSVSPLEVGGVRMFSENDPGAQSGGSPLLRSPECDDDYRLRAALDTVLDVEVFNYAAQNTGKHNFGNTTMAATWNQGGFLTNSGNITTTTTGCRLRSYNVFPLHGTRRTYVEMFVSFSAAVPTNSLVDFGLFIDSAANPFAPTDGAYFSFQNGSISGVCNFNGSTTQTRAITFTPSFNRKYKFCMAVSQNDVQFWIDDELYATVAKEAANGTVYASYALPVAIRHAIVGGAAGAALSVQLANYFISVGGGGPSCLDQGVISGSSAGTYQGVSGGTMGSLASWANNTNPTPAVPTNTTSTVLTALGGQGWETDTAVVSQDMIICSYQVPAAAVTLNARRLAIYGVKIDGFIQTALTGGGYNATFAICFGHTAVSLATAEAATTKAPRRKALGSHTVASGLVALSQLATVQMSWSKPIIVNPGEYVAISKKKIGTAPSAGVIGWTIDFDCEWV